MIQSFCTKEEESIFSGHISPSFPFQIQRVAFRKLCMIDASTSLNDLRVPPANHLELLRGKRKGQYSIRINRSWRICFNWRDDNAYGVEIVDYH